MNKKAILAVLIGIVLLAGLVGLRLGDRETEEVAEDPYVPVEVETSIRDTISDRIVLNGTIRANDEAMVMPMAQGRVDIPLCSFRGFCSKGRCFNGH